MKTQTPAKALIDALKFLTPALRKASMKNCTMLNNWTIASNGVLSAACKIEENLNACPQSDLLLTALQKCGEELVISQLDAGTLSVKSGDFRAIIPCVSFDLAFNPVSVPDPKQFEIDDRIKSAIYSVISITADNEEKDCFNGVLLQNGTTVGIRHYALLEYWHGLNLGGRFLLPKASASAIAKCKKTLTGFGSSKTSATFYFEDESFYKTQLFDSSDYPAYENLFSNNWPEMIELPAEFWTAVQSIEAFCSGGSLFFEDGFIGSCINKDLASTYRIQGLPDQMGFNAKYLLQCKHAMTRANFDKSQEQVVFASEAMRGILKALNVTAVAKNHTRQAGVPVITDDDIPF